MADGGSSNVDLERVAKRPRTEPSAQLLAVPLPSPAGALGGSVPGTSWFPHEQTSVPRAPRAIPHDGLMGSEGTGLAAVPPAPVQHGHTHEAYSQPLCSTQGGGDLKWHTAAATGPAPGSCSSSCCSICKEELTEGGEHDAARMPQVRAHLWRGLHPAVDDSVPVLFRGKF